jgi:MYXO-CTERM domain-containing protein
MMRTTLMSLLLLMPLSARAADFCQSNIIIVLDRSCSMADPPSVGQPRKWDIARAAIAKLTTNYKNKLDFGLIMFPDKTGANCTQEGGPAVAIGPAHESEITTLLNATEPDGPCVTDIKPAIDQVSVDPAYASMYTTGPRGFVLFISDGKQTCGGNTASIQASFEALYARGYPSYVVGFGGEVDAASLDLFAEAGGVPRHAGDAGGALYYQADDATSLDAALDVIAGEVLASEFAMCPGVPCPDGRCFGAGEKCVDGACVVPSVSPDLGSDVGAHTKPMPGCSCQIGGAPAPGTPGWSLLLLALVAVTEIARRRKSRGGCVRDRLSGVAPARLHARRPERRRGAC